MYVFYFTFLHFIFKKSSRLNFTYITIKMFMWSSWRNLILSLVIQPFVSLVIFCGVLYMFANQHFICANLFFIFHVFHQVQILKTIFAQHRNVLKSKFKSKIKRIIWCSTWLLRRHFINLLNKLHYLYSTAWDFPWNVHHKWIQIEIDLNGILILDMNKNKMRVYSDKTSTKW